MRVFFFYQFFDLQFDNPRRNLFAVFVQHPLGKKAAQLDHALRRVRIFAIDHARHGREVHPDIFRNVLQHHRLDVLDTVIEKILLPVNDGLDHPIDGLPAMLDVTQEVNGRTHLLLNEVARLFRGGALRQHLLVSGIDAQSRAAVVGKVDNVLAVFFQLLDVDFGRDENWFFRGIAAARIGIEGADELQLRGQRLEIHADLLREVRQFVLLQFRQVIADEGGGQPFRLAPH